MNSVKVKDIYFGSVDGLKEAQREDFTNIFYTGNVDYYDQIVNKGSFIIQGRKGTGKTLLAHFVKDKILKTGEYCIIKNLDCFKEQKFINLKNRNFENGEEGLFWKWVILLDIGKIILENKSFFDCINKKKKNLNKFINKLTIRDPFKINSKSTEELSRITGSIKMPNTSCLTGEMSEKIGLAYSKSDYLEILEELETLVVNALNKNVFLIYDDLDEMRIDLSSEFKYQQLINGLLLTVSDMNIKYMSNKNRLQTIIVIRDDIASKIHPISGNSNKKMSENTIHLSWFEKNNSDPWKKTLTKLILFKAKASNNILSNISDADLYKKLFPEKADRKKDLTDSIFDRTHGRPRDFIAYINFAASKNPDSTCISKEMYLQASTEYSNWFYNEILNEMSIHKDTNFILDSLKLIASYKQNEFQFDELRNFYTKNINNFENINNFQECIDLLYTFGVIGNVWYVDIKNKKGKTTGKKLHHSWSYRPDGNDSPDPTKTFIIHYGLRKKFS